MGSKDIFSMLMKSSNSVNKVTKPKSSQMSSVTASNVNQFLNKKDIQRDFPSRWKITGTHLISNVPLKLMIESLDNSSPKCIKIAAFDLDDTLVNTKSGSKFARSADDWQLWTDSKQKVSTVVPKITKLVEDQYIIVIFTNQGGVIANNTSKSYLNFTKRVNNIIACLQAEVCKEMNLAVFASPKRPASKNKQARLSSEEDHTLIRKPNRGMWDVMVKYFQNQGNYVIDMENSFYVGDAAGRPNDFSDSDMIFAKNVGLQNFMVPETYFLE